MASLLFVCHGNVCRSTMAQFVFDHLVRERGVQERFSADSAATSREEIGKDVHRGTRRKLAEMGIACGHHRARQMTRADYDAFDLIIGMDAENLDGMYRKLARQYNTGVLTGKGSTWGGSVLRPEATGFGALYFTQNMLHRIGKDIKGCTIAV